MATTTAAKHRSNEVHYARVTTRWPNGTEHRLDLSSRCNCAWQGGFALYRAAALEAGWARIEQWLGTIDREYSIREAISDGHTLTEYDQPF
jgi:hypothetical protein